MGKLPYFKCFPLYGFIILFSSFLGKYIFNIELRLFPLRQNYRKKLNVWKKSRVLETVASFAVQCLGAHAPKHR